MIKGIRRSFDEEFRTRTVKLILSKDKKISELSRELNVNENTLHLWKKKYLEKTSANLQSGTDLDIDVKELKQLYKDLASVREENEILKKALGIFSRQMK